jgi:hypothetical protein
MLKTYNLRRSFSVTTSPREPGTSLPPNSNLQYFPSDLTPAAVSQLLANGVSNPTNTFVNHRKTVMTNFGYQCYKLMIRNQAFYTVATKHLPAEVILELATLIDRATIEGRIV